MKKKLNILVVIATLLAAVNMVSCSDDKLGATIFDTKEYALDKKSWTFPLDTFVKVNFLEPYNMRFVYRMEYIMSDKDKNLTPASYENSCKLAVLTKYLWYDVYNDVAESGNVFLKHYSPRIIHVVGSKSLNTSSGTETLGVTEGGSKITLYRTNLLDPNNIDDMNEYFFETMHHEFGHILDNTKLHPTTFNMLSNGHYNSSGWSDTPDSVAYSLGFVSPYASMSYTEDWVETLGRYITRDSIAMEKMYGSAEYDWETLDFKEVTALFQVAIRTVNKLKADDDIQPEHFENWKANITVDVDTIGYVKLDLSGNDEHKIYRRICERDQNGFVVKYEDKVERKPLIGTSDTDIEKYEEIKDGDDIVSSWYNASKKGVYCISYENMDVSNYDILEVKLSEPTKGKWKVEYQLDGGKIQEVDLGTNSIYTLDVRSAKELTTFRIKANTGIQDDTEVSEGNKGTIKIDHVRLVKYKPKWTMNTLGAKDLIDKKIEFVREYMKTQYGIDLDKLRYQIQAKQYRKGTDGKFIVTSYYNPITKKNDFKLENALVYKDPTTGKSVLDLLLEELDKYKALQNN